MADLMAFAASLPTDILRGRQGPPSTWPFLDLFLDFRVIKLHWFVCRVLQAHKPSGRPSSTALFATYRPKCVQGPAAPLDRMLKEVQSVLKVQRMSPCPKKIRLTAGAQVFMLLEELKAREHIQDYEFSCSCI